MGYGDGTIVSDGKGGFRGARMIGGKRVYARGRTRTEVRTKLRTREEAAATGVKYDPRRTVGKVLEAWLAEASPNRARVASNNTLDNHRWAVEKHLVPNLGRITLDELTREDIEGVFKRLAKGGPRTTALGGLSETSLKRLRAVLHMALDWAVRQRWVRWNVASGVELPRSAREPKERKSLTPREARRLVKAAKADTELGPLWLTMLGLGLRPGEATGLGRGEVDLEHGVVRIRFSLARESGDGGPQVLRRGPVKAKSERDLALPPALAEVLAEHLAAQEERHDLVGLEWQSPEWQPVFTSVFGRPLDPANTRRAFKRLVQAAQIERDWTPYELRHSTVSLLSDLGTATTEISDLAGHRTTRMVETTYRHRVKPAVEAARALDDLLAGRS